MGKRYKWDSWRDINGEYKDIFSKDFMNWGFSVSRILHFILSEVLNYVQEFGSTFAVQIVAQISTHRLQEVGTINNILNIMTSLTMFFTLFHEHVMFFFFFFWLHFMKKMIVCHHMNEVWMSIIKKNILGLKFSTA